MALTVCIDSSMGGHCSRKRNPYERRTMLCSHIGLWEGATVVCCTAIELHPPACDSSGALGASAPKALVGLPHLGTLDGRGARLWAFRQGGMGLHTPTPILGS